MLDHVQADKFYQDNADKIKLNWFCYEYANNLYSSIAAETRLSKYRRSHSDTEIADFCLHFSKRMRKSVYDKLTDKEVAIAFRTSYVREFYPSMREKQMETLLEVAMSAWNHQLHGCSACSHQCLNSGFDSTDMFDNLAQSGWPTR